MCLTVVTWNCASAPASCALADIEARAAEILHDGKFPLLLGGEHLVTLGAVRAAVKKYPDLHIVHFDAHADLRDDYLGAKLSHACVLRRCHELVGDGHIHQFCIRSGDRAEFEFAAQHTEMHKFDFTGLAQLTAQLCESKVPVYLDHRPGLPGPLLLPRHRYPRGRRRQLFAAAGGHPHRHQGQHHRVPTSTSWPPRWTPPGCPPPPPARCSGRPSLPWTRAGPAFRYNDEPTVLQIKE